MRPPVRILIIQLARLGDGLQSLMALRAAKQLYPELEITMIVREQFSTAPKKVSWISKVYEIPTKSILEPLVSEERTPESLVSDLAKWLRPIIDRPYDMVINWTFNKPSSYLAALIPGHVKLGFSRSKDGKLSALDGWTHYIQGIVQGGCDQDIHLTDILTTQLLTALQIHVGDPDDPKNASVTSRQFFHFENTLQDKWRDHSKKWIGIQLGASQNVKSWEPEHWAGVAAYIISRHPDCAIVLLGNATDMDRKRRFEAAYYAAFEAKNGDTELARERLLSQIGEPSCAKFDHWAQIVGRCQWILTCDTSVVHLASILGTRVFNLSFGGVKYRETGPYGNGHYVLASQADCEGCKELSQNPTRHTCRDAFTCEGIYAAWSYASTEWVHRRQLSIESHAEKLGWAESIEKLKIMRSRVRAAQDGGGVVYEPLIERTLTHADWSSQVIGCVARAWYCGWIPPIGHEIKQSMLSGNLLGDLRKLKESTEVLAKICDEAAQTSHRLHSLTSSLKSASVMSVLDREEVGELGRKLMDLDELMDRTTQVDPTLVPFSRITKVLMHNLQGSRLADLGRESALTYEQLSQGLTIVKDWIKHTLDLAKPRALSAVPKEIHPS